MNLVCALRPEAGALCGSSARRDLCGGRRVTGGPTATGLDPVWPAPMLGAHKACVVMAVRRSAPRIPTTTQTFSKEGMSQKSSAMNTQEIPHLSVTPHEVFSNDLKTQEKELKNSPLMKRFAESRLKQAGDPYRPIYHFVSPESMLNDPNGLCYFKGKWHMFYQAYPPDEFPKPTKSDIMKRRAHWGHAISDD